MRLIAFFILLGSLGCACRQKAPEASPEEITMRVNYYRQRCQGEGTFDCLLVQTGKQIGTTNWDLFYDDIAGFRYEPGYLYTLQVRMEKVPDPPMDGSDRRYILVKVVSKKKVN